MELPSFDDLVKSKSDPHLADVRRTILGAGHYSEHIARWMRYYNAKQVSPVKPVLTPAAKMSRYTMCSRYPYLLPSAIPGNGYFDAVMSVFELESRLKGTLYRINIEINLS